MSLNNFRASVSILTKIFQTTYREAGMITRVQLLEGPPPKFPRAKKRPNFGAISDNFRVSSRISPERIDISNIWEKFHQPQPLPRWAKKLWWTLVHKRKSSIGSYWPTHVDIFLEITFRPLGVAAPWNFVFALEIDQGYLAHTQAGTGVPPPKKK